MTTTVDCRSTLGSGDRAQRVLAQALLAFTAAVPSRRAWAYAVDRRGSLAGKGIVLSSGAQPREAEESARAYRQRYVHLDPLAAHRFLDSTVRLVTLGAAGDPLELARSTYGREFFSAFGWTDEIVLFLRDGGRMIATIALLRSRLDPPFADRDVVALARMQPLAELAYLAAREPGRALDGSPALSRHGLTAREIEVARVARDGRTNKEIALALAISVATVKRHLATIYRKLGVRSRAELVAALAPAMRLGAPPGAGPRAISAPGHDSGARPQNGP